MSLGFVVKASQEKTDDHALVYWPEEDCVSVVKIACTKKAKVQFFLLYVRTKSEYTISSSRCKS